MPTDPCLKLVDLSRSVGKQVDLVLYKGGERIVIGKAIVEKDGAISAQIAKDLRADVKEIITGKIGDVSINPQQIHIPSKTTYVSQSTKIQEKNR